VAVRSRTPFGELSKSQKAATFKEIIQFTGKDVLSFIEYACRSATTDLKTESMQVGVSTPKIFKERVADIMADVLPKTQVHECTVPKALAIKADCFMSDGSYVMMRAHHPKFCPPLARLKEEARRTEPRLAPLLDENEQVLGYYCTNIWTDLIVPEITSLLNLVSGKGYLCLQPSGTRLVAIATPSLGSTKKRCLMSRCVCRYCSLDVNTTA
jgi:hypothetical protein